MIFRISERGVGMQIKIKSSKKKKERFYSVELSDRLSKLVEKQDIVDLCDKFYKLIEKISKL